MYIFEKPFHLGQMADPSARTSTPSMRTAASGKRRRIDASAPNFALHRTAALSAKCLCMAGTTKKVCDIPWKRILTLMGEPNNWALVR